MTTETTTNLYPLLRIAAWLLATIVCVAMPGFSASAEDKNTREPAHNPGTPHSRLDVDRTREAVGAAGKPVGLMPKNVLADSINKFVLEPMVNNHLDKIERHQRTEHPETRPVTPRDVETPTDNSYWQHENR